MSTSSVPVTVDADSLADAGTFLRSVASTIGDAMRRMDSQIDGMAVFWRGDAAQSYSAGWSEVSAGAVTLLSSLEGFGDLLGIQSDEFDSVDETLSADLTDSGPVTSSLNL
ncbi:WXG100 family type VII secretion target [Nocardia zapadnayensis]|nr:WXG100 family type VII secretion target [Nocardia zapadnayensis]MCX0270044.1 WXG100 family type VII secretion target [Nocardia zapadnayensis]